MSFSDTTPIQSDDLTQKQLFEAIFQNATMGIIITDQTGKITLANKFALESFSYSEKELLGKRVEDIIPSRFHHHHVDYRNHYNAHAETRAMGTGRDLYGLRKDGSEFPVEVSLSPFKKGDQLLVIAFIIDITVRKEKELAEKEYERALISLNKEKELNEMKSKFISMASHEFKTPLSTILSSASLISKYPKENERAHREKHVARIKASVSHLNSTLNDFLDFGRIENGKIPVHFTSFPLEDLLTEVLSELEHSVALDRNIQVSISAALIIYTDRHLLKNILLNLLSNALKFSEKDKPVEISCYQQGHSTRIIITDHGVGIASEDNKQVYNLFYRGNNVLHIAGTGLGLAIVSRYVDLIHAKLNFTSTIGEGTTFTLTLSDEKDSTD